MNHVECRLRGHFLGHERRITAAATRAATASAASAPLKRGRGHREQRTPSGAAAAAAGRRFGKTWTERLIQSPSAADLRGKVGRRTALRAGRGKTGSREQKADRDAKCRMRLCFYKFHS